MISAPLALKLCGFLYIYILITNAASVGLGNKTGETDSAAKLLSISENPDQYRISVIVAIASHLGIVAITGTLLIAFGSYNRQLALIGSVFRLGEALAMIYGEVTVLRLIDLARKYTFPTNNKKSLLLLGDHSEGSLLLYIRAREKMLYPFYHPPRLDFCKK